MNFQGTLPLLQVLAIQYSVFFYYCLCVYITQTQANSIIQILNKYKYMSIIFIMLLHCNIVSTGFKWQIQKE